MAKAPANIRSLARAHTAMGIRVLAGIAQQPDAPAAARVAAIALLFDRGWGKAPLTFEDEGGLTITVRQIVDEIKPNGHDHGTAVVPVSSALIAHAREVTEINGDDNDDVGDQ